MRKPFRDGAWAASCPPLHSRKGAGRVLQYLTSPVPPTVPSTQRVLTKQLWNKTMNEKINGPQDTSLPNSFIKFQSCLSSCHSCGLPYICPLFLWSPQHCPLGFILLLLIPSWKSLPRSRDKIIVEKLLFGDKENPQKKKKFNPLFSNVLVTQLNQLFLSIDSLLKEE